MRRLISVAIVAAISISAYERWLHRSPDDSEYKSYLIRQPPSPPSRRLEERAAAQDSSTPVERPDPAPEAGAVERTQEPAAAFQCDGREYCSQMHSCAEATWFLQHCPDTKMDGDADGVPCEQQWCGG